MKRTFFLRVTDTACPKDGDCDAEDRSTALEMKRCIGLKTVLNADLFRHDATSKSLVALSRNHIRWQAVHSPDVESYEMKYHGEARDELRVRFD